MFNLPKLCEHFFSLQIVQMALAFTVSAWHKCESAHAETVTYSLQEGFQEVCC